MNDNISITEKDYARIKNILSYQSGDFENLEIELERANLLNDDEVPNDLITMNSKVKFINLETQKEMIITIVYPSETNFEEGKISILASLGSALIGLKVSQEINWKFPNGKTQRLKVLEILYQPERSEDWHL